MKLTLLNSKQEASDVKTFTFQPEQKLKWKAGQYLHYILLHPQTDDRKDSRYFTISSAPFEQMVKITTRFAGEKGSSFKKALFNLKPGDLIEAENPEGDFTVDDPNLQYVFISGGIGITPYRAILLDLDQKQKPINVTLIYANRNPEFVFKDQLESLAQKYPSFKIKYLVSPKSIDQTTIKETIANLKEPIFYISGPKPMVQSMQQMLLEMGIAKEHIKTDDFPGYDWP